MALAANPRSRLCSSAHFILSDHSNWFKRGQLEPMDLYSGPLRHWKSRLFSLGLDFVKRQDWRCWKVPGNGAFTEEGEGRWAGSASFKPWRGELLSWALAVLGSLSEHGSNMLCKHADCGLGRLSKAAICVAALGPDLKRTPSQVLGFTWLQMSEGSSFSEPGKPTLGEPWMRPGSSRLPTIMQGPLPPEALASCPHVCSWRILELKRVLNWGHTPFLSRSCPQNQFRGYKPWKSLMENKCEYRK